MKIITAQEHQTAGKAGTLELANDVDPRTLDLNGVTRIDLQFPAFTDGRAYSQAFLLRRRLRFADGEEIGASVVGLGKCVEAIAQSHVEVPMILTSVPSATPDPTAP